MTETQNNSKKCFVICPIGEPDTAIRTRSDRVLKYIIKPIVEEFGYTTIRADQMPEPGVVTSQIIQHLIDADLVIADLTDGNPNVYYELAVRHLFRKPTVQIIHVNQRPSFDVTPQRTISFDYQDLESVDECKERLKETIRTVEKDPSHVDSPISQAIDTRGLLNSNNPGGNTIVRIFDMLEDIGQRLDRVESSVTPVFSSGKLPRKPPWTTTTLNLPATEEQLRDFEIWLKEFQSKRRHIDDLENK